MRRIREKYEEFGVAGLMDQRGGKPREDWWSEIDAVLEARLGLVVETRSFEISW